MDESERLATIIALQQVLAEYEAGSDFLISCLVASAFSTRKATVCTPFPPGFIDASNDKDYAALQQVLQGLAPVPTLRGEDALNQLPDSALGVLRWLLLNDLRRRRLHLCPLREVIDLCKGCTGLQQLLHDDSSKPSYVLRLEGKPSSTRGRPIMAFHGTSMECMHSIIHNGLLNLSGTHLQRSGAIFGNGIYLSTEFSVAFSFCQPGPAWEHSVFGDCLRCLLVCEVDESFAQHTRQQDNGLPGNYLLVSQASGLRVTHVLLYRDRPTLRTAGSGLQQRGRQDERTLASIVCLLLAIFLGLWWQRQ